MRHTRLKRGNLRGSFGTTAFAATCIAALVLLGGAAQAQVSAVLPVASHPIAIVHNAAKPITGWVRFCEQVPSECAVDVSEPAEINLTKKVWQTIVRVNRQINTAIKPETDKDHWDVDDQWNLAEDGYGDCEDYQLLKRKLLAEAGLPRRAMRMTVVIDEDGQGHAVMMVRTNRGDYILDNKRNAVLPWHQTGYTYVKREGDEGSTWASLGGVASPVVTAGR